MLSLEKNSQNETFDQRTLTIGGGSITVFAGLKLNKLLHYMQNNIFSSLVKSSLVKLGTSSTVILEPMVSVLR